MKFGAGEIATDGSDHPIWPDDGSLSAKNKDHIAAGLWALDTVNPKTWSGVRKYMESTAADVLIAQETKLRDEATDQDAQSARLAKWNCSI